ncbi:hypothetical protein BASA50_001911 [Batrachochytrium salamandrivorans]|uniref:Shugoshin C-terminal domain-containing protein n=1 Tax=Batrachochytrium salamandrivorans TaxID=1357716 RepID=A0ABQ8FMT8_9FUNG|nr:hypothetical protein BASA50_001911 [Batrachochytrium salamandrivorans]KAJ1340973.1 hypothetical protein BSLG_004446 [Batrachochytrium salamandrivorans]
MDPKLRINTKYAAIVRRMEREKAEMQCEIFSKTAAALDLRVKLDDAQCRIAELEQKQLQARGLPSMKDLRNASQATILAYRGICHAFEKATEIFDHHAMPGLEVISQLGLQFQEHTKDTDGNNVHPDQICTASSTTVNPHQKGQIVPSTLLNTRPPSYPPRSARNRKTIELISKDTHINSSDASMLLFDFRLHTILEATENAETSDKDIPVCSSLQVNLATSTDNESADLLASPIHLASLSLTDNLDHHDYSHSPENQHYNEAIGKLNGMDKQPTTLMADDYNITDTAYSPTKNFATVPSMRPMRRRSLITVNYKLPSLKVKMRNAKRH